MPETLTLSRAARLVGITRGALQKKIRDGALASFEGMVRAEDLVRAFPGTQLEDVAELARVQAIKERAFGRRVFERLMPDKEVLAARLAQLGLELAEARTRAARLEALLAELRRQLPPQPLGDWLRRELEAAMAAGDDERAMLAQANAMRVIAPHVRVQPGGQEFFVEGADTLLEAALRVGHAMAYGCSSGNCGECKARVVAGRVRQVRPHDYRLTEREKQQGMALMCCVTALTDLVIEASVAHGAGEIPQQNLTAHVRKTDRLSDDVMLLELLTPRTSRLRFLAGQSAVVGLGGMTATLPIASCPCEERRLHFHLRRIVGNRLSDYAFDRLRIGEPVTLQGPVGDFVLRGDDARPLVFVAWGWQGFAPVKSVIEHALAQEAAESVDLYWIGASPADLYYPKLCRSWAEAMDEFRYTPLVAHASPRETIARAFAGLGELPSRDFYLAGEADEVEAARAFLGSQGVPQERIVAWSAH